MAEKESKEILRKSAERVRKYSEVYTPMWLVKDMCDMLGGESPEAWTVLDKTFLEPACGNGNFLVEIFERKLKLCRNIQDGLTALRSIYGIDILQDNVEESRQRLFDMFVNAFPSAAVRDIMAAEMILENNIICGDSLKILPQWAEEEDHKCGK